MGGAPVFFEPETPVVRVVVGTRAIVAQCAREQPVVRAGEWDARGYALERVTLWREALQAPLAERGIGLQVVIDRDGPAPRAASGPRLDIGGDEVGVAPGDGTAQALLDFVAHAARAVAADTGGWRRFLQPSWFARHRAWRREVGSPIQH